MSDQWGSSEPDASGSGGHNSANSNINISVPGLPEVTQGISALTEQLLLLQSTMATFGQQQQRLSQGVVGAFNNVASGANTATESIKTLFQSMGGQRPAGSSLATILDYGVNSGFIEDALRFPMRFMQSTIGQNRQFALNIGGMLSGQQYATGIPTLDQPTPGGGSNLGMYTALARTFGSGNPNLPMGTGEEIAQWLQVARQAGAQVDIGQLANGNFGTSATQNPRAPGFVKATQQIQEMYPSMALPQIGATLGGFVANSGAQRQGAMLTGGAFSMIKSGGAVKSVDEWAEGILRWLENSRPGGKRGQGFNYGELMSQQFPGSNMDAWFEMNGVPQDMREVFWNYALAKARTSGDTSGSPMAIGAGLPGANPNDAPNLATTRLQVTQPMTESSFNLAGRLGGLYNTREQVNKNFNTLMGSGLQTLLPKALSGGLNFLKYLPDTIEELLSSMLENAGTFGAGIQGAIGWGGVAGGGIASLIEGILGPSGTLFSGMPGGLQGDLADFLASAIDKLTGDVGDVDVGDWGAMGATSPNSLHPSMNSKVSAMMKANPRLKVNSGRRDEALQRKLKANGHTRVSGKSSAHTRGLAADMGPASEYGWLMKNAAKFGLQSGAKAGEPWHVGMPGIGDTTTDVMGGIGSLLGLFSGAGSDDIGATVSGSLPGLFNFLFGQFGTEKGAGKMTDADIDKALAYDKDFAKKMFAAGNYKTGGAYGSGTKDAAFWDKILKAAQTRMSGGKTTASDIGGNQGGSGSETLAGALSALGMSSTGLSDGAMVALLANKAGWTGTDLVAAVAISKRESGFLPTAHRSDVDKTLMRGDRGLWQINAGAWNDWLMEQGYIKDPLDRAIFDPWVNAQAAHGIYARSGNFGPWTMGPNGWDANGDPFYGTDRNEAEGYVREAGLATSIGDVDTPVSSGQMVMARGGGAIHFNNTFVIQGGGGNSGIDSRRLVVQIADQLEAEMRSRTARSN